VVKGLRSLRPTPKGAGCAFRLALDHTWPWQKEKLQRKKEKRKFPSGLKKKFAPKRARSRLAVKPPAGLGLNRKVSGGAIIMIGFEEKINVFSPFR